jgi:hypothetical protein
MVAVGVEQAKISGETIVVAAQNQVSTRLEDEAVILHFKDGVYYGLNRVGAWIWNLIQEPKTVNQICDLLLSEFEVDPRRGEDDLLRLLQELADHKLIEIRHDSAA